MTQCSMNMCLQQEGAETVVMLCDVMLPALGPVLHKFCDLFVMCDCTMDQRANLKFCAKPRKSTIETLEVPQEAFDNKAVSWARCFE